MGKKRGPNKVKSEKHAAAARRNAKLQRFRLPTPKGADKDTLLASVTRLRQLFGKWNDEFSRQLLEDDLRDPKTNRPLMETRYLSGTGRAIRVRAHVPLKMRHEELESLRDRLGMPRQSEQSLVTDGKLLGPEIRITLGDFQRPGAEVGVRDGDAELTAPIPPVAENGSGNGVAH